MADKEAQVVLSRKADLYMHYASMAYPSREVMGLGRVEIVDGIFYVRDIIIPPHEVTGGTVEWRPEMMKQVLAEMAKEGQVLGDWRLWWHSHGTMQTSPSSTDTDNLAMLADEIGDWTIGIVTNSNHSYKAWMEGRNPIRFSISDLKVAIEGAPEDEEIMKSVTEMMKGVTVKSSTTVVNRPLGKGFSTPTTKGGGLSSTYRKSGDREPRKVWSGYGQGRWGKGGSGDGGTEKVAEEGGDQSEELTIAQEIEAYMNDNGYYGEQGQGNEDKDSGSFLVDPQTSLGNMGIIQKVVTAKTDKAERELLWALFGVWLEENVNGINIPLWCMKDDALVELKALLGEDFADIETVIDMQTEMVRKLPDEDDGKRGNGRGNKSKKEKSMSRKKKRAAARQK